ncbi:hypothetical protein [Bailinhaonella thermotolerans]|uniref:Uncharacterized protein n=1 Tax=Bailinhaonella thermotolerans TaxID=1070861 RepID=A0A3A4B231_9ACTN|nr:hypothetical protein [Bailinhaonella thermotolerans]RJL35795.1 hypothetical protein D5H75_03155 [Bailinhaonella thermotolerans]
MRDVSFPMHQPSGRLIQLIDILDRLPDNRWVWVVREFWGVGVAPHDMSMEQFEGLVRAEGRGYALSWPALREFAAQLEQTHDCTIFSVDETESSGGSATAGEERPIVEVRALDSGTWVVSFEEGYFSAESFNGIVARLNFE